MIDLMAELGNNKNIVMLNSGRSRMLLRLSAMCLTLKLKFDCRIRLVIESGAENHKHHEEPSLVNNVATFSEPLEFITGTISSQKYITLNVFVISSRNKYKAGICRLEMKDIVQGDEMVGTVEISRKLEQCPDKQAGVSMTINYELVKRSSNAGMEESRQTGGGAAEEERCGSTTSVNDLARFHDFHEDARKSYNAEVYSTERRNPIKQSLELLESGNYHRTDRMDNNRQLLKRASDMIDTGVGRSNTYEMSNEWVINKLKRASFTPKIESTMSLELKKPDSKLIKQRISMEGSKNTFTELSSENKLLKSQISAMKESIRELSHQNQIKMIEISEGDKRIKSLKQLLEVETTKSRTFEHELRETAHKYKQSRVEIKQKMLNMEMVEKRAETKLGQYKEEIEKLSTKMLKFENDNQNLLFEVNQLKDHLLIKDIDCNNSVKALQFESLKNSRSAALLNSKIEELEAQIQLLNSKNEVMRIGKEQLEQDLDIQDKMIKSKEKQILTLKQQVCNMQERETVMNEVLLSKTVLVEAIIKKLEEINIKNDQMKVQYLSITQNQIIEILSMISKFIKDESFKIHELMNQLLIKDHTINRLDLESSELKEYIKKNIEESQLLNNLYEQTKFRLQVQITNVEVLEQQLFNSKADLQCQKQNRKDNVLMQERLYQLQSQNEDLLAHLHQLQKDKMQYFNNYNYNQEFYEIQKGHKYKDSRTSNFSDQEDIKNFINHLHVPVAGQIWQSTSILESPIKPTKEGSIISEDGRQGFKQTPF